MNEETLRFMTNGIKAMKDGDYLMAYTFIKRIMDDCEETLKKAYEEIEKMDELEFKNEDARRLLVIKLSKKKTISNEVANELSLEELRKLYKASESGLKMIERTDLVEKYSTVEECKSIRVTRFKD